MMKYPVLGDTQRTFCERFSFEFSHHIVHPPDHVQKKPTKCIRAMFGCKKNLGQRQIDFLTTTVMVHIACSQASNDILAIVVV